MRKKKDASCFACEKNVEMSMGIVICAKHGATKYRRICADCTQRCIPYSESVIEARRDRVEEWKRRNKKKTTPPGD